MNLLKLWVKRCCDGIPFLLMPFFIVFFLFWITGISVCYLVFGLIYWARLAYEKESKLTVVLIYLAASLSMWKILQGFVDVSDTITVYMHNWIGTPVTTCGIGMFIACLIVMPILMFFSRLVEVHFAPPKSNNEA